MGGIAAGVVNNFYQGIFVWGRSCPDSSKSEIAGAWIAKWETAGKWCANSPGRRNGQSQRFQLPAIVVGFPLRSDKNPEFMQEAHGRSTSGCVTPNFHQHLIPASLHRACLPLQPQINAAHSRSFSTLFSPNKFPVLDKQVSKFSPTMTQTNSEPKLLSFLKVLQDSISVFDTEWNYQVPGLPSPAKLNAERCIKVIALETKDGKHRVSLRLQRMNPNRGITAEPLDKFAIVSISSFRSLIYRGSGGNNATGNQPATARECTDYVVKMLRRGISIQGVHYNFYGHSNSQLKSRTCFLFAGAKEEISRMVDGLGDFSKMKTVQKKAKRIGLLFSEARTAMIVPPDRCEDIPDIETADCNFTDGCGLISPHLAQELARRVRIVHRDTRYTPSVFQIRYRGYKGVLMVDRALKGKTWIKFRKSMKKFSGGDDLSFSVVEYSKVGPLHHPFTPSSCSQQ